MSKIKNAQYQQNIDIIKGFFKKPLVLVVGILTLVSTICHSVSEYISVGQYKNILSNVLTNVFNELEMFGDKSFAVEVNSNFSLNLFSIAMGIAFILLFAHGRSNKNYIRGSATYFKVLATIEYVACFIIAVCAVILIIGTCVLSLQLHIKAILITLLLILGFFIFLGGFSKLKFAKSICNSMDSIYLSKSGAGLFAVISFIYSVPLLICFAYSIFSNFNPTIATILFALDFTLQGSLSICMGIFAVKYSNYITGIQKGTMAMPVQKESEKAVEEPSWICNNCGTPFTEEDIFCHVCGNKLK